ncbi:hypothetical protein GCM10007063_34420 [Lentibacillus kapialis]|uniref:ISL3 family transposase n=1 Tax=Lentibacillus kapialis TaxID=340214 RepID=A0A917Q370_9BACI|nr:transposase [Lentibacillus kapialis]GGK09112.1 hypothetical protein GCM10007063_34420 [Lentibacillus kapialis]
MYCHYINKLLNIPEIHVNDMTFDDREDVIYFQVEPVQLVQTCPCCGSTYVKRNGTPYKRQVRHLPLMKWRTILLVPSINMTCMDCDAHFVWQYDFVKPKKQYTQAFQEKLIQQGHGTTIQAMASFQAVPYATAERYYKRGLAVQSDDTQATCIQDAMARDQLVLGIDDFAARKGHTYNTGIHDLKGGSFLDIIPGRKMDDLQAFQKTCPYLHALNPVAVVMDMSYTYHKFTQQCFPQAIRIADRFHVNRYVTDAMHDVRKDVQKNLPTQARKQLKRHHHLLEKRYDALTHKEQATVQAIFTRIVS